VYFFSSVLPTGGVVTMMSNHGPRPTELRLISHSTPMTATWRSMLTRHGHYDSCLERITLEEDAHARVMESVVTDGRTHTSHTRTRVLRHTLGCFAIAQSHHHLWSRIAPLPSREPDSMKDTADSYMSTSFSLACYPAQRRFPRHTIILPLGCLRK
jgi:hypothetical protein